MQPDQLFLAAHLAVVAPRTRPGAPSRQAVLDDPAEGPRLEPLRPSPLHDPPLTRPPSRRACASSTAGESLRRPGARRARARSRRRGRAPTLPWPTWRRRAIGSKARASPIASATTAPRNALRDGADEHGHVDAREQLVEPSEEIEVVVDPSSEPDPGVGAQCRRAMPAAPRDRQALDEEVADLRDHVVVAGLVLHRARLTLHVHGDVARHRRRRRRRGCRGRRDRGDVVDDGAPASSAAAATAALLVSMLTGTAASAGEAAHHREHAAELLGLVDRLGAGPGRLAADVERCPRRRRPARDRARPRDRRRGSGHRRRTSQE